MRPVQEIVRDIRNRLSGRASCTLDFGPVSVTLKDVSRHERENLGFFASVNTAQKLQFAREKLGIKPLSLGEVLSQINGQTDNLVLFDTADASVTGGGNHWRVLSLDQEKRRATLRLCSRFGTVDYQLIPPMEVPFDAVMFTGISFQEYTVSGTPVKLADVVKIIQENINQGKEALEGIEEGADLIYFSDAAGILQPKARYCRQEGNIPYGTL